MKTNLAEVSFNFLVFLDIDGVLVTSKTLEERYRGIHNKSGFIVNEKAMEALNYIVETVPCSVVLSSSWRFCGLEEMVNILNLWGFKGFVLRGTEDLGITAKRGDEIKLFIDKHIKAGFDLISFAILDDLPKTEFEGMERHLVETKFEEGLTMELARKAVEILNEIRA